MYFVAWSEFPFSRAIAKSECAANHLGYHAFFVRANDADRNPAGVRGNHPRSLRIARLIQFNAEEAQPIANPGADRGRILSDATRKHQRVQSAERRSEGADPFLRLVAEQRHGFGRPHVLRFTERAPVGSGSTSPFGLTD